MDNKIKRLMAKRNKGNPYISYIIFGAIMLMLPILIEKGIIKYSYLTIVAGILIYSIVSLGLNLLIGYSGLVSLGTAGFMGLGAYMSAYLTMNLKLPFELSLIISVAIPMLLGVITGLVSLRIEGYYLAIATLVISEILRKAFGEFGAVTNGFSGKSATLPKLFHGFPKLFNGIKLDRNATYVLIVVFLIIVMMIMHNLINSYTGRALSTMRGSEAAAQAMGINIYRYRLLSFAVAVGFAALGGVLYVHFIGFSHPNTWTLALSLNILAVIIIGGVRSIPGTILGAFIVFGIPDLVLKNLPIIGKIDGIPYVFTGVLIIIVILFYPAGLIHIWTNLKRAAAKLRKKKGGLQ